MPEYDDTKALLIRCLIRDAEYHEAGEFDKLGNDFDQLDVNINRDLTWGSGCLKLVMAFEFWDGWLDARNHEWRYYDPIKVEDWPVLARRIVADLEADRALSDPMVLERFGPRKPATFQSLITALGRRVEDLMGAEKMDRGEAKAVLIQNLSPYSRWSFDRLHKLVGEEKVIEVDGASGTKYNFEIYVAPVSEIDVSLLVEGYVTLANGRRWFPTVEHAEFGVSSDDRLYYQSTKLD